MFYEIIQSCLGNDLLAYYQCIGKDCNSVEEAIQILNSTHDTGLLWYLLTKFLKASSLQLQLCSVIEADKISDGQVNIVNTSHNSDMKAFHYTLESGDIVCFKVVKAGETALMPEFGLPRMLKSILEKVFQNGCNYTQ